MKAKTGQDPAERYGELTERFGAPCMNAGRPATGAQKAALSRLSPDMVAATPWPASRSRPG
jgi:phosphoglucomutase